MVDNGRLVGRTSSGVEWRLFGWVVMTDWLSSTGRRVEVPGRLRSGAASASQELRKEGTGTGAGKL